MGKPRASAMTAIAGYVDCGGDIHPADACHQMLGGQLAFGPHDSSVRSTGRVAFGRNLFKTLPEDSFDRQPLQGGGGRFMLAADVRIDNRGELSDQLGIAGPARRSLSDAALLLVAWEKWSEGALDRILGDYAFALWDEQRRELLLVRSPLSLKALFYHVGGDFIAFASTPAGLHALESIPKVLDLTRAASFVAGIPPRGAATFFQSIRRVEQGHVVRFKDREAHAARFWKLDRDPLRLSSRDDYAEALREQVDRAVAARLRRFGGEVACHLSGGRDSNAVAATAARVQSATHERVLAYTSAPRTDYRGPTIPGTLADESALASATARLHPNMDHCISRPDGPLDFTDVQRAHQINPNPLGHLSNFAWWDQIDQTASRDGASVLLIGHLGNFGLSAGGEAHLPDLLSDRGLREWWKAAWSIAVSSPARWRSVLNRTFAPNLPRSLYPLVLRASGRGPAFDSPFLRSPFRDEAEAALKAEHSDFRPPRSFFDHRRDMLYQQDGNGMTSLARWGIDTRDPTADRRLVEFCFSLPVEALVSAGRARPLFEAAMSDRIAPQILSSRFRGYQSADWHELITKDTVSARFSRYKRHALVSELLDVDYVQGVIDRWPSRGWDNREVMSLYRNEVLGVLSLADFIVANFQDI